MEIYSVKAIRMALFARCCSIWIAIIQEISVLMRQRAFSGGVDVALWLKAAHGQHSTVGYRAGRTQTRPRRGAKQSPQGWRG